MRLNKFLSAAGVASRRKADQLILQGKVKVNGIVNSALGSIINEKKDKVEVDGKIVSLPLTHVYLKLNKPKGCTCTASDEKGRKTIFDLVDSDERLFSIGRLDYNTEGLILLTNDGEFANIVAHPSNEIEKEYIAVVEGIVKESELAVLRNGVVENGKRMPKAGVKLIAYGKGTSRLSIVIHEGQNRQVRRMFEAIGREIKLLKRVRIGNVKLGGLNRGESKAMSEKEIALLTKGAHNNI